MAKHTLDYTVDAWYARHPAGYEENANKLEHPKGRWMLVARFYHFQHALDFRNQIVNNHVSARVGKPNFTRPLPRGGHLRDYTETHPKAVKL